MPGGRPSCALLLGVLLLLSGCDASPEPGAVATASADPCAAYPPPFEASYLPEGFEDRLRSGEGLFTGTDYPTEGLLGHYRGPAEVIHVNFQVRNGPLPYEPANPRPLRVLGRRGLIGKIEGGWSVELSFEGCDFRMDTYGIDRAETVKVARGLRATR